MTREDILRLCDHTLLLQTATWEEIKGILDDGITYGTASACIPPCFVERAKQYVGRRLKICTVIGFPNGNSTTESKAFEAKEAIKNGADEIDMVLNIGALKERNDGYVLRELKELKRACGERVLKVIIETCLLTEEEKIRACRLVSESGADFIKTSTGFSSSGATEEDVLLLRKHVDGRVKVKAAGGISSFEDAEKMIAAGAERLGTSRLVKIMKNQENKGGY